MISRFKKVLLLLLPIQIIVFKTLSTEWIEQTYIPKIFLHLSQFLRYLIGKIPFSVGLLVTYILIVYLVFKLALLIFSKQKVSFKILLINILSALSFLYFAFMLSWGLVYHRQSISQKMDLNASDVSKKEVQHLAEIFIKKTNKTRILCSTNLILNTPKDSIYKNATKGFISLKKIIGEYKYVSIKSAVFSNILSYLGTAGMYYFFSGEANINKNLYAFETPYVTCHEMAHQMGIASEEEASFISYLACQHNENLLFQYSANAEIMNRALNVLYDMDSVSAMQLKKTISPQVISDFSISRSRWLSFQNPFEKYVSRYLYDWFLKSNGQKDGSKSYDLVVNLMVAKGRKTPY